MYNPHKYQIKSLLCIGLMAVLTLPLEGQLYINEFVQSNLTLMDDWNEYPDSWVELYNAGNTSIHLNNYAIGEKNSHATAYTLSNITIEAKGYCLIYCDTEGKGLHTDFRIDSDGGKGLFLFDANGQIVDSIGNIKEMPAADIAYGRTSDGGTDWSYFVEATPNTSNNHAVASNTLLPYPVFGQKGGVYAGSMSVPISKPQDAPANAEIRFTTDGSEPSRNSTLLSGNNSVVVSKTTVIRAKLFASDALSRKSVTQSYIMHNREVTLPIISLCTDSKNLYDSKIGIYIEGSYNSDTANYKYDWRRPMNIELYNTDGTSQLNQWCEGRISGAISREYPLKSFILYTNKRFGNKFFKYEFWNEKPEIPVKSFVLRNSGNDFGYAHFRDAAIQLMSVRGGMDLDWQAYQPAILYLNGSYMGIINIRERSTENYVYSNYNKLEDIDMIENWYDIKAGDMQNYNAFKTFYAGTDNTYQQFEQWMDVSEFMNMFILNTYHINLDFPSNNIVMWRPRAEGGKWRWIIKDTDFGLGLYGRDYTYNYLNFILRTGSFEENWANGTDATRLFRRLINNNDFKQKFIDRFAVAMGDYLNSNFGGQIIDSLKSNMAYEYPYHKQKYASYNSWLNWDNEINTMKTWMGNRTNYMYTHLKNFFSLGTTISVNVNNHLPEAADLMVSFNENRLSRGVFDGKFYVGRTIRLQAHHTIDTKKVAGWKCTQTISGSTSTEIIEGESISYTIPTGCTQLVFETIISNETGVCENRLLPWNVSRIHNEIVCTNLPQNGNLSVIDLTGRTLYQTNITQSDYSISLPNRGCYLVKVTHNGTTETQKTVW